MFFSLVQTLVCVLLINGGMYALHLTGTSSGGGPSSGGGGGGPGSSLSSVAAGNSAAVSQANANMMHLLPSSNGPQHLTRSHQMGLKKPAGSLTDNGRLPDELADIAQLERERLMFLGLAKQTAAAAAASGSTSHHGRPIITGRIQMTPADEVESDYPSLLMQQARGLMFGNVVKHPSQTDDYESEEDFDGGGGAMRSPAASGRRRRPVKYEYGRVVQPQDHEFDPQQMDLDAFMELENEPEVDEMIPDLEGYQYIDELLGEQAKWDGAQADGPYRGSNRHAGHLANPLQTLEELEVQAPQALQELFEKEQRHEEALKHAQHAAATAKNRPGFNIKMQQKWQRKRAQLQQTQQQKQQWQRNIFGHTKPQATTPQLHHFNPQAHGKYSETAASVAADKQLSSSKSNHKDSSVVDILASDSGITLPLNHNKHDDGQVSAASQPSSASSSSSASVSSSGKMTASPEDPQQQQQHEQRLEQDDELLNPNHKRSGSSASGGGGATAYGNMQQPVSHSIASQLMLRSVRGQRQYDVPQIECPTAMDGMERFACPTPDLQGRYRCIDDHVLCDGFIDCPEGEDEDRRSCMFYKTTKAHLDVLADALLRWARGR